jgi:poly(beta-D-mannuronate) lyase
MRPLSASPRLSVSLLLTVFIAFTLALPAHAATHTVTTLAALQSALATAAPGDTIRLANGTYPTTAPLIVTRAGTAAAPITIVAESVGGVTLSGRAGFRFTSPAAHIVVSGFVFTHASGTTAITAGATHIRITRCVFACTGAGAYLTITGDDAQIDRCEFRDKRTLGNMISVTGVGAQVARRVWIHHNYFHDFANAGGNGAETIRFGLSGLSMSTGAGLVEHNLFVRCLGENELISNKSCGNTYRYNTFLESPGTQLTLRHGNDCLVYGNIFRGTDGLRIFGDRHQIFSNYFEKNSVGINLGNGGAEVADGAPLTSHDRPDHCVIAFNTLIDNATHYKMTPRTPTALGATHTTFAYNLIRGGGRVADIGGPNPDAVWRGNLLWQTGPLGHLPPDGATTADPLLVADASGIFHLSPGSPALAAAGGGFPAVNVDLDGQPRPLKRAIGADEVSAFPARARLLTPADVGPASADAAN